MDWRVERTVVLDQKNKKTVLKDRIHALGGKRNQTKYMWLHHEAAQNAALLLEKEGTLDPTAAAAVDDAGNKDSKKKNNPPSALATGSHLLPPVALFKKGDVVQVRYEDKWWSATVTKRPKKKNDDDFYYSVIYHGDDATQDEIAEEDVRPGEDPSELAVSLGLDATWGASRKGSRFVIVAPCGKVFQSKKAATKHFRDLARASAEASSSSTTTTKKRKAGDKSATKPQEDAGDPPWRREGHDLIERKILWTFKHKASARRLIAIEQVGVIEGYIDESDTDKAGSPGYVSEKTGKPANLFHVVFDDDPGHPYAQYLLQHTDLEEFEILDCLLPPEVPKTPSSSGGGGASSGNNNNGASKKKRRRS